MQLLPWLVCVVGGWWFGGCDFLFSLGGFVFSLFGGLGCWFTNLIVDIVSAGFVAWPLVACVLRISGFRIGG